MSRNACRCATYQRVRAAIHLAASNLDTAKWDVVMDSAITRRNFIKGTATAGMVLVVGLNAKGVLAIGSETSELNPFVRVSEEGVVTVVIKHFEMGRVLEVQQRLPTPRK
ncbi:hypothetical protein A9Q81_23705 [Gammaproteobacteria bacterium 42_54_T18]|nr:hypothetical protein A9Q81_23705 [Gammaproteobacteria bacterium 42_54_T18]